MGWTKAQEKAIFGNVTNTIVSAGAGSGKTLVLSTRILTHLKNNIDVRNLIVLTFTNAAAKEMKERVIKNINKNIDEFPKLKKQLNFIENASITTFDSFALSLVKKHHYLVNLNKNISIVEKSIIEIKKDEILNEIFLEYYENDDSKFVNLIEEFCVKNDNDIKKHIKNIRNQIDLLYDKEDFLNNYIKNYYNDKFIKGSINQFVNLIEVKKIKIKNLLNNCFQMNTNEKMYDYFDKIKSNLSSLLNVSCYNDYCNLKIEIPRRPSCPDLEEEEKQLIKSNIDNIKSLIGEIQNFINIFTNVDEVKYGILSTKDNVKIIIEIIQKFDKRLMDYKLEINNFEFSDIFRFAINIVKNNQFIQDFYKSNIYEIMIDEYQDTSNIQDYFISLISKENTYIVGDVKQSIYGFRNANPNIFIQKYDDFSSHQTYKKIDMNKNFRSRKEVINNINKIFSLIMDKAIGGVNYKYNEELEYGNKNYDICANQNYNMDILNYDFSNFKKDYSKTEVEAFIIGNDIKEKIENKYQIFDKDKNILRDSTYSDFTILISQKKDFILYYKIFNYLNIPLLIHNSQNFINSDEIYTIKNILNLIYLYKTHNFSNIKHSLYSVLRSFVYGFDDETIINLINNENILNEIKDLELIQKVQLISSQNLNCYETLLKVYQIFGIYEKSCTLENVDFIHKRLDYLLDISKKISELGYNLQEFIDYLEILITDENLDVEFNMQEKNDSVVNIMSIHNSKGLEYNVCYFSGLDSKFKLNTKDHFFFNYNYGIIIPFNKDNQLYEGPYKYLINEDYKINEISERIRLFYVALTRACEKIIMVCDFNKESNVHNNEFVNSDVKENYSSFLDFLISIKKELSLFSNIINIENLNITANYEMSNSITIENNIIKHDFISIKRPIIEEEKIKEITLIENDIKKSIEFGTKLHKIFEYFDYSKKDITRIEMENRKYMEKFLNSDLIKNFEIENYITEYEFIKDNKLYKIDLILESKDKILLIDYKLKNL
ncbi:MAG: UvrD-helicase domain-containing protein [Bacilli bacterium]